MIRKIFRYRLVSVYFIISQLIVFTAVFGVLQIYNKAFAKENDRLNAIGKNRIELDITSTGVTDILTVAGKSIETGNAIADGKLTTEFTEAGSSTRCEVILSINEELPYPMINGHIPGTVENDFRKNSVALGRDKYKYSYERDGKHYVTLDHQEYEVVGVIGSEKSDYWDYKIVFNINCISESTRKKLNSFQNQVITLSSNSNDLSGSYEIIYNNIKVADSISNIVPYKKNSTGDNTISNTLNKENIKLNNMVYFFCLLNCIILSVFWIVQRKKELAIKKTFGYSNIMLMAEIASNIISMMIISFFAFMILYGVYRMLYGGKEGLIIVWNTFSIVSIIAVTAVTVVITMIYPICKICYEDPAKLIGGKF